MNSVEIRRAEQNDLAGEYGVFVAALEELHRRRGADWTTGHFDDAGPWAQVQRHLLVHDGDRCFVAVAEGRVVGFTAAAVRDRFWFFAALFIDPAFQGQGVGRQLFDLAGSASSERRVTITEAMQPVSNGLYARKGMIPVTPMLALEGPVSGDVGDDSLEAADTTPEALRAIDNVAYGFDRAVDHEFWRRTSTRSTLWLRRGKPCAYSYGDGLFGIGPVAGLDPFSAASALGNELVQASGEVRIDIPGSATSLVEVALRAGLRFGDPGLLLVSPPDTPPPTSLAIHSYWLL